MNISELIIIAQKIFDETLPRVSNGNLIRIPFDRWTKQSQDHFLALAKLELSRSA